MAEPVATAYIALGSNLGDRLEMLRFAIRRLVDHPLICVTGGSPVFESPAMTLSGGESQPDYLNAVIRICTPMEPDEVLALLLDIEREAGRVRNGTRWAPRPLDLDVLSFGDQVVRSDALTLPHPRLAERRFVLEPWARIAPDYVVPGPTPARVDALLAQCEDPGKLSLFSESLLD
ncbi:MAG: 2-amino-4-hydroxy-6-hydroxymethyldihydropteridine diphosphokinase [Rhodothermales bacterium]